jgi:hypothetical protein
MRVQKGWYGSIAIVVSACVVALSGTAVPQGSEENARAYYAELSGTLKFKNSQTILESTLDDVPRYLGYSGLSANDLQRINPSVLMEPTQLGGNCSSKGDCATGVDDEAAFATNFAVLPLRPGDILASRFLAPKIANMADPPEIRALGWRKLVRLNARQGSEAAKHEIAAAVILFNFFTKPAEQPFTPASESVNTQVMLLTKRSAFTRGDRDSLYWLDYGPLSAGGKLSVALDAFFDASDLQGTGVKKPYYVPDGCIACHGENPRRPMVNYLDTDHWFDRLDDDFANVRAANLPVLFDGGNDTAKPQFVRAFDAVRQFNEEAEAHSSFSQPQSTHRRATVTWLRLHRTTDDHLPPVTRTIGAQMKWRTDSANDRELLGLLNRYCFRCHGTITFDVFDKAAVYTRRAPMARRLNPTPEQLHDNPDSFLMPPDRKIDVADRNRMLQLLRTMEAK